MMPDQHDGRSADPERLRRAQASMAVGLNGIGRAQSLFDRLSWILWGIVVVFVGGIAMTYLVH